MNIAYEADRLILGDRETRCPKCDAPAAVHYASNGKAEVWHLPTDCCDWARVREKRFAAMARRDYGPDKQEHLY